MDPNKTKHLLLIKTYTNIYFQHTVGSPDPPTATGPEQNNEVRKKSKNIQTLSIFSNTNRLHNTNIYFQYTVASPDPKAKGTVQSNAVRKKNKNIQTLSILSRTNQLR
jgi:hypothetical protein